MRYFVLRLIGFVRRLLPLVILIMIAAFFWKDLSHLNWGAIVQEVKEVPTLHWGLAVLATAASFWSLAQYDVVAHRFLTTGVPPRDARVSGACAISVAQCTGFGPIVGSAVRLRMLPSVESIKLIALTAWVSACFIMCWLVIGLCISLPLLTNWPWGAIPLALLGISALTVALILLPELRIFNQNIKLPSLRTGAHMLLLAGSDLACAAFALWLLLPDTLELSYVAVFSAYVLALGAGLIANTPGGAGPFEMVLLLALPQTEAAPLMVGLLAFRIVYYIIPGLIGGIAFLSLRFTQDDAIAQPVAAPLLEVTHPEHAIAAQSKHMMLAVDNNAAPALLTRNTLALFRGPSRGTIAELLDPLKKTGLKNGRIPCLYKISARDAAEVRKQGWHVADFSREAYLDPRVFALEGSEKRQLRRILRKAEQAGVRTGEITAPDWDRLSEINAAWSDKNGGEHGLTMGRFDPHFLQGKPIFGARQNGRLIAFISCVESPTCLSLDVMRRIDDCPAGTMHALVIEMINGAADWDLEEVCLAGCPSPQLLRFSKAENDLTRFKKAFSPNWRRLYFAAPTQWDMLWAGIDLRRNIIRPAKIPTPTLPEQSGQVSNPNWQLLQTPLEEAVPDDIQQKG